MYKLYSYHNLNVWYKLKSSFLSSFSLSLYLLYHPTVKLLAWLEWMTVVSSLHLELCELGPPSLANATQEQDNELEIS